VYSKQSDTELNSAHLKPWPTSAIFALCLAGFKAEFNFLS